MGEGEEEEMNRGTQEFPWRLRKSDIQNKRRVKSHIVKQLLIKVKAG